MRVSFTSNALRSYALTTNKNDECKSVVFSANSLLWGSCQSLHILKHATADKKKKGPKTFDKQHSRDATKFSLVCTRISGKKVLRSLRLSMHLPQLVTSITNFKAKPQTRMQFNFWMQIWTPQAYLSVDLFTESIKNTALPLKQTSLFLYNATFN